MMSKPADHLDAALVIALLLIGGTAFLCAFGYFTLPAQETETWSELKQSQKSGNPISDEEIESQLGRLRQSRMVYGLLSIPCGLSGAVILTIIILRGLVKTKANRL